MAPREVDECAKLWQRAGAQVRNLSSAGAVAEEAIFTREKLKYALRVPFCIALPLYCVHEQPLIDKSRIRNFWSTAGGAGGAAPPSHRQK